VDTRQNRTGILEGGKELTKFKDETSGEAEIMKKQFLSALYILGIINLCAITAVVMYLAGVMIKTGGMPQFAYQEDTGMGVLYSPTHWRPATRKGNKIIYRGDEG
jgi:hypothetical protein